MRRHLLFAVNGVTRMDFVNMAHQCWRLNTIEVVRADEDEKEHRYSRSEMELMNRDPLRFSLIL